MMARKCHRGGNAETDKNEFGSSANHPAGDTEGGSIVRSLDSVLAFAGRVASAGLFAAACMAVQAAGAAESHDVFREPGIASGRAESATRSPLPIRDNATLRRDAKRAWYGGDPTPEYRRFLAGVAETERQRHGASLPRAKAMAVAASAAATTPTWVNLGPTRADFEFNGVTMPGAIDSGRVSSIVVHPTDTNIIYVATSGGGVWKTASGGRDWAPITDALGSLAVGSLEMDPRDPNTLYLGLGDPFDGIGLGFLKSMDGGMTWSSPIILTH
jgi:hypothetical protein